ncbi:MAG: hypothetical protein AAGG11_03775 [Pseudomonadota bacterium]
MKKLLLLTGLVACACALEAQAHPALGMSIAPGSTVTAPIQRTPAARTDAAIGMSIGAGSTVLAPIQAPVRKAPIVPYAGPSNFRNLGTHNTAPSSDASVQRHRVSVGLTVWHSDRPAF